MIRGVDWNSIFPIWNRTLSDDPAANGPRRTVKAPLNASATVISSENAAIRSRTMNPTRSPPTMLIRDARTEVTPSRLQKDGFATELFLFVFIQSLPPFYPAF